MATPADGGRPSPPERRAEVSNGEGASSHPPRASRDGLPDPTNRAGLLAAEAPPDAAEAAVLAERQPTPLGVAWLNVRQFAFKALGRLQELRPRELNLSWITDSLAVGGAFRPNDVRRLKAQGVSAVVDLREEAVDDAALLARHGIKFLHLPTPDLQAVSQADLDRGVDWVLDEQAADGKVLVH